MMATTSSGGGTSVVDRLVEMFPKHSRSQLQDAFDLCSCTPKSMDWYGLQTRIYKSFLREKMGENGMKDFSLAYMCTCA